MLYVISTETSKRLIANMNLSWTQATSKTFHNCNISTNQRYQGKSRLPVPLATRMWMLTKA